MRGLLFQLFLLLSACSRQEIAVNLAHLNSLCSPMRLNGRLCTIVHIYADAPDYSPTDAAEEGIACVDDVARAAVVYMKAAEKGLSVDFDRLKGLLRFVLFMQTEDGEFYNFIDRQGFVNTDGPTSRKSFAFWAARGYWALGEGYTFFRFRDRDFADSLKTAFLRCKKPISNCLQYYGTFSYIGGRRYPAWLPQRHAADAASELLLGLAAFLRVEMDPLLAEQARKLAEGIVLMQIEELKELRGAYESWPGVWHAWGNAQVQALSVMAGLLKDEQLKEAAVSGGDFLTRLAVGHPVSAYEFENDRFIVYPQIAYDVRTTALGLLELYRLTGDERYAILAALSASWLTGFNLAREAMYDRATGRVYDGIDPEGVNRNSGAESTIEGLLTLLEIGAEPRAAAWLGAKPVAPVSSLFQTNEANIRLQTSAGRIEIKKRSAESTLEISWEKYD